MTDVTGNIDCFWRGAKKAVPGSLSSKIMGREMCSCGDVCGATNGAGVVAMSAALPMRLGKYRQGPVPTHSKDGPGALNARKVTGALFSVTKRCKACRSENRRTSSRKHF